MGGSLGGIFSGVGQGGGGAPSLLQNLVQGTLKGAGTALGKGMQAQGQGGTGGAAIPNAPSATPVDPRYFQPTAMNAPPMMPGNGQAPGTALYG